MKIERRIYIISLSLLILVILTTCGRGGGGGTVQPLPEIGSWAFVDTTTVNSINKDATKDAGFPQITVFDAKLYATWREFNGIATQIRVAVHNGNNSAPSWAFVDGNGTNGINKDVTKDVL